MSQTLEELGRIFTAVGNGAQWQFATLTRPEAWHDPDPGFGLRRAVERKYHIRLKPWTLPPPPAGREWYRGAEFTETDLPDGYRPLLVGDRAYAGDEAWLDGAWRHTRVMWDNNGIPLRHRTKRPLPDPDPYAELKAAHAAGKVIQIWDGCEWETLPSPNFNSPIEKYRVKPDPVQLGPEDVPPMSLIRKKGEARQWNWRLLNFVDSTGMTCGNRFYPWEEVMHTHEILRPGEDWKPCHKEPS